jgi:hypothetical protein
MNMDTLFTKLNYKQGLSIYVLNPPEIFMNLLTTLPAETEVRNEVMQDLPIDFVIIFVTQRTELENLAQRVAPKLKGDAIFWLAYPKGTSKKYTCDFNRDTSWGLMTPYNMMPVRQISIDEDWSALRFRKTEYIKSEKRKAVRD